LEKLEKEEINRLNRNDLDNEKNKEQILKKDIDVNTKEESKGEDNIETTEDEDFLILRSVAKLKHELSEREKNCEDLHGWDEDF